MTFEKMSFGNFRFASIPGAQHLACTAAFICLIASPAVAQDKVDFVKQIKPIFEQYCMECHGPEDDGNGFRIDRKDESLEYVSEEDAEGSDLYAYMISDDEDEVMPPPDYQHQMNDAQRDLVKQWINQGAPWPDDVVFVKYQEPEKADGDAELGETGDASIAEKDDEAEEKAEWDPKTQTLLNAAGTLHPAAVHLPIGLLMAAGFFAMLSLRGSFVMSDCAYYCLWLGVLGSIVACVTGWFWSPLENKGTVETFADIFDDTHRVYWHRLGGLILTIAGFVLALFAASARNSDPDEGNMWKFGAILLAVAVAWVGHTGGELHYGQKHYKYLHQAWEDMTGGNAADPEAEAGEPADADQPNADELTAPGDDADKAPGGNAGDTADVGATSGDD